ncbi:hypothetical protein H4582DRAFT_2061807 [Lactarius indigo]|nr:hypothetical protein H4582DRAFT_2061807 [Lactarius indigo]
MNVIPRTFSLRALERHANATRKRNGAREARSKGQRWERKAFLDLTSTSNEPLVLQVFRTDVEITPPEKGVLGVSCRRPFQSGAARPRMQLARIYQHYPASQATRPAKLNPIIFDCDIFPKPELVITLRAPPDIP